MTHPIRTIQGVLSAVETAAAAVSVAIVAVIMALVGSNVVMRYAFDAPLNSVEEVIGRYLMPGFFYLSLAASFAGGSHVRVDILSASFPPRLSAALEVAFCLVGAALFAWLTWIAAGDALHAWSRDEVIGGLLPVPVWPSPALVAFGSALFSLRLALDVTTSSLCAAGLMEALPQPRHPEHH